MVGIHIEVIFKMETNFAAVGSMSEKLMNDIMDVCQDICEDIGCVPDIIRYIFNTLFLDLDSVASLLLRYKKGIIKVAYM